MNTGFAHHQAGRLARAEALYRRALAKAPEHAEALHLLGVIACQRGEIESAITLIERALPELHDLPEAHLDHGNALREAGWPAEAEASYRRAISLAPDYGMAHSNLARVLNDQGLFGEGLASARRAIELIPDFLGAQINCAASLLGLKRLAEAEAPLRRALESAPNSAQVHSNLGRVLTEIGQLDEALSCHERAIELDPNDPMAHFGLAYARFRAHEPGRAEVSVRCALSISPELAAAWQLLGNIMAVHGRFDEALTFFRRALAIDPDLLEAHHNLAVTGQHPRDETQLDRLAVMLADPHRAAADRIAAGFALGRLLDTADRYDDAFACFAQANALDRQQRKQVGDGFDPETWDRDVDRLITAFTPTLFSAVAGWGSPSQVPVFIVGMPRSGTSLVEQIAASHSQVRGMGELRDIGFIAERVRTCLQNPPAEQLNPDLVRDLAAGYLARLQSLDTRTTRVIDKMPDNILHLGLIAVLFPRARVVLCQRDARDTCLSCYFQWLTEGHPFACDLADCGRRFLAVDRLATHWLRVLPLEMLVIDYERLVVDLEGESRRLIEFLGLDWEPSCLEFHKTARPVFTGSIWQVRQPLYTGSVGRWLKYERHLGPLLDMLEEGGATG